MSVFLGIGLGPIQSGIFIAGAFRGGFDRIVIAEVDAASVAAIRENGQININIAGINGIRQEVYERIEIYNPLVKTDLNALIQAAAEASELSTALPDVSCYRHVAPWLREGFARQPERQRFVYAAENNNRAAEILHEEIGQRFSHTHYLNTVIGKMCKVFKGEETPDLPYAPSQPHLDLRQTAWYVLPQTVIMGERHGTRRTRLLGGATVRILGQRSDDSRIQRAEGAALRKYPSLDPSVAKGTPG